MRVLTWNINSVRLRLPLLLNLLKSQNPDIFCLQETKCPDDKFPLLELQDAGYPHIETWGMKGYNGLCIASKTALKDTKRHQRIGKSGGVDDCRHMAVTANGFDLHNLYIPAGGYEADAKTNPSFQHKLDFVDELADWFPKQAKKTRPMIVLGDLNIAPLEHDVWNSKQMQKVVSHTPVEREKFARFFKSLNFIDAVRQFVPEDQKLYSWWSYRNQDWKKSDRGRRLDHIWVTGPLVKRLKGQTTLRAARDWERPSDHVPVILDLKKI